MAQINSGTIMLAFFAVLFGLAGTYAIKNARQPVVEPQLVEARTLPKLVTVPVASRDIPAGGQIVLDDVALLKMNAKDVRTRVKAKTFMTSPKQIIGKTVLREIKRGSTFDTQDFYPQGKGPGILDRLRPGQRAITINVSPIHALIGFAGPGQNVDVLFHYALNTGQGQAATENGLPQPNPNQSRSESATLPNIHGATSTIVQNAEILALQKRSLPTRDATGIGEQEYVSITLAVTPQEAELLRVAGGHGELSLTLRPESDANEVPLVGPVTLDKIIEIKNNQHEMEIYRGQRFSRVRFQGSQTIEERSFHSQTGNANNDSNSQQQSPIPPASNSAPNPVAAKAPLAPVTSTNHASGNGGR